ncbi:MAG: SpoIID/LytB domain-containing protein [Nocardioidaceae bacterium]
MNTRRLLAVTTLAALLLGSGLASAEAGPSAAAEERTIAIRGHGFGHGIGMSQYGAEGAARAGKNYRDILGFYYPGTSIRTAGSSIKVLITKDTTSDVKVSPRYSLSVRDWGDGAHWRLPVSSTITRWRLVSDRIEYYRTGTGWVRYRPGGRWVFRGTPEFYASGTITLWVPSGSGEVGRRYRGALRAARPSSGSSSRDTVNVLPLESYLRGVVADEMPASWRREALKSQAVAARTYAVRTRAAHSSRYYHICDTTACQVYGGVDAEHPNTDAAISAVSGRVLRSGSTYALTMFSSSNGGYSADGGASYLVVRRDPWDGWSGNPMHSWSTTVNASTLERAYPSIGRLVEIDVRSRNGYGEWGGRVRTAVLDGTEGNVSVTGSRLRSVLGLRSDWFNPGPVS